MCVFFSSRRRHTRCALVTGVQTCALPICEITRPTMCRLSVRWSKLMWIDCKRIPLAASTCASGQRRCHAEDPSLSVLDKCSNLPTSAMRSEELTSELQSLMRISYADFCLKKKNSLTYKILPIQVYIPSHYI